MSPGKPPPSGATPREQSGPAAPKDVNQRTGAEDRATRDSFGDMDEAAAQSSPADNPAIVTAVRGHRRPDPDAVSPAVPSDKLDENAAPAKGAGS